LAVPGRQRWPPSGSEPTSFRPAPGGRPPTHDDTREERTTPPRARGTRRHRSVTGRPRSAVCVLRLASLFSMVNRGYGRTLLAPDRMQFSTLVSRRSIPCSEITRIEAAGGFLLVVRTVALTGLRTLGRSMPSSGPPRSAAACARRWRTGGALRHPPPAGRGRTGGLFDQGLSVAPVRFPRGDAEQYGWDQAAADGPIATYPVAEPHFCHSAVLRASRTCVYWAGCPGCPRERSRRRSCLRDRRYDTVR
jgi:hypothetical protein